jgi:hypothetical protein
MMTLVTILSVWTIGSGICVFALAAAAAKHKASPNGALNSRMETAESILERWNLTDKSKQPVTAQVRPARAQ